MTKHFYNTLLFLLFASLCLAQEIPSANLQLWLRADSVEITGGFVSRWYDLSSNNYSIIQATAANRPLKIDSALNNLPLIKFDGINDYLDGGDVLDFLDDSHTIFIITKTEASRSSFISKGALGVALPTRYHLYNYDGVLYFDYHDSNLRRISKSGFLLSKHQILCVNNDRLNNINKLFINGDICGSITIDASYLMNSPYSFLIGALNSSTGGYPPAAGFYLKGDIAEILVYDTVFSSVQQIQIEQYLMNKYSPPLSIGEDISIAYGFCDTILTIDKSFTDILWSTGETNDTIYVNQSGEYTVQAYDIFGRIKYDTINIQYPIPDISNSFICLGDSVLYNPNLIGSYLHLWSDLTTDESKYYKDAGDFWLRIEDDFGCFDTVFFTVEVDSFKNNISLGNDTSLCSGNTIQLIQSEELCSSFLWTTNNNTEPIQIVNETGWQKLEVENENGCTATDSIYVTIIGTAPTPNYIVENLCFGDTTQFIDNSSSPETITDWKWIINENDTLYTQSAEWVFETIGIQNIELIVESESGCANNLNFTIEILPIPDVSFTYAPVCTGVEMSFVSEITLPAETNIVQYNWFLNNSGISNNANFNYLFTTNGNYELKLNVQIDNGCAGEYSEIISVENEYPIPAYLSLISPYDGYNINSDNENIEFSWNTSSNANYYKFQLSQDIEFTNILSEIITEGNNINLDINYDFDSIFWQVISYNPCLEIINSETRIITKFKPTDIINTALWLCADSVEIIDNKVARWYDLSNNNYEITQETAESRPVFLDSSLNNQPIIKFDGVNDYLDGGNILNFGTTSRTSYFIFKASKGTIISKARYAVAPSRYGLFFEAGVFYDFYYDNANRASVITPINKTVYNFVKLINSRPANKNQTFVNSALIAEQVINGLYDMSSTDLFLIGSLSNSTGGIPPQASFYTDASIAEIIIFDTILNDVEQNSVRNYLQKKYSPPVNLLYDIRVPYGFCDTAITTAYKPWFTSYEWSTGETDSIIHVNRPGVYSVTVTDIFGFESSDDIRVFYPQVNNFADTIICYGNSVIWDAELTGDYSYEWLGSPETTQSIEIFYEGDYALIITDSLGCKYYSDTINFSFDKYELTASIGPADTLLCVGNRLSLITNSEETVEYLWSSGEESPEIALFESGTYSVTTTNWRGCEAKDEISVIITGTVPIPDFSVLGHCAKNIISFSDLSTSQDGNINYWRWSVNGEEFANSQNSEIILEEAGIYNINLEIKTDADCGDYLIKNIEVFPLPKPNFSPDYYCQWAEIDFKAISTIETGNVENNYWKINDFEDFGDSITYIFENSGFNTVKLISESEQACKDSIIQEVFVKQAQKPEFLAENTCVNTELSFVNITNIDSHNLPISWIWDFGDENFGENSDPSHIYVNPGIYNVNLSVIWQNMCETSINKEIEVYANPELELLIENYCLDTKFKVQTNINSESGEITEYLWSFNGKEYSSNSEISPNFICDSVGEYPISLEIKSEYGCKAFAQDSLKIYPLPQVNFAVSRDWGGFPFLVEFTNLSQGANQYLWTFGDLESSTEENPSHIYNSEAEFLVSLLGISEYGCFASAEKKIISVNPIMDLILYNLRTKLNGNYLEISVYIINNGTLPVTQPELILNLGDGKVYRESLEEIQAGEVLDYKLKTEIWRAEKTLPEIICLEIFANPFEGHYETKTEDNLICAGNVKNLVLFLPYPNPASQSITVEYVLSKATDCVVRLINSMGEKVYEIKFTEKDLHNKFEINVEEFAGGVYYLQVIAGEEQENRKIILR